MASAAAPKAQLPSGATKGHGLKGAACKSYSVVSSSADRNTSSCCHHPFILPAGRSLQVTRNRLCAVCPASVLQASAWERTAQLDDQQLRVIDALAAVVGHRPFPAHVSMPQLMAAATPRVWAFKVFFTNQHCSFFQAVLGVAPE